jgi:hypothetical protein
MCQVEALQFQGQQKVQSSCHNIPVPWYSHMISVCPSSYTLIAKQNVFWHHLAVGVEAFLASTDLVHLVIYDNTVPYLNDYLSYPALPIYCHPPPPPPFLGLSVGVE